MKAVWYEKFGAAKGVLTIGSLPDPTPNTGEVLVRLHASGVNPSDVKLRAGARPGAIMEFPKVVPHSDGAGVIEAVGAGVDTDRIGQRVWIWNGQWKRAYGTAAELISIPADHAVYLPKTTSFAEGACLGIPAMTAWYSVFADGSVEGKTVLVTGGAGTVGRYACQMAKLGGARVITTVSSLEKAAHSTADEWINYRENDVAEAVMSLTDGVGVDRIVDVDFGANQATSLAILKQRGVIATYASASVMRPVLDFYPFMFKNSVLRMLIVYLLDPEVRRKGEAQITKWLEKSALLHAPVAAGRLDDAVAAHQLVEAGDKLGTAVLEF
ncbi:NADPH:quinone reductase [Pseudohalocynthiibacter sp. F2068]|uniref:NADPH:quinone reductase n=1 Tax=Pseudohalocynthiibacter sp. F2068 TaxID=2926418 RepID=UPI001FF26295|nr:NADPH:quinone reductase [Pseudohalocynthiibacter sp. F2068]MCK0102586.1 NADPH:quinone reductase [Pseudohalocynthiibacter sp. F2068]